MNETVTKPRLIISTDVETLGRVPGLNPLLSIGAAALLLDETVVDTFEVNLEIDPQKRFDLNTMDWWCDPAKRQAWERTRKNAYPIPMAMMMFEKWLERLEEGSNLEFLAKPAAFDIGWLQQYSFEYAGKILIQKYRSWDLHSLMAVITGMPVTEVYVKDLPEVLRKDIDEGTNHVGIDDAIYQGRVGVRCINHLSFASKAVVEIATEAVCV